MGILEEENQVHGDRFFFEAYFQRKITPEKIQHALEHAMRHGFDLEQLKSFDLLQVNQFVAQAHLLFRKQKHSYPRRSIDGYFNMVEDDDAKVPQDILELAIKSIEIPPDDVLHEHRFYGIESVILKHFKKKKKLKRRGRTSAILNEDMHAVTLFLEYVLCFHD